MIPSMNQQIVRCIMKAGRQGNCYRILCHPGFMSPAIIKNDSLGRITFQKKITTESRSVGFDEEGMLKKFTHKVKFNFKKYKLRTAGFCLYEKVADELDYAGYMKELKLPDTFQSWFQLTELHIWMIMARLMADNENGRFVRNCLVEALWQDVTARTKKLGGENAQAVRTQVQEMSEQFQAALVSYDEGLLSGDTVLAGAVWRRLLNRKNDPEHLEAIVRYIRKTMYVLDKVDSEEFIMKKNFSWLPVEKVFSKAN